VVYKAYCCQYETGKRTSLNDTVSTKALCFRLSHLFVCLFIRSGIVTTISHERLEQFDKTDREYSPAPAHDLIRFWRSKVKVTAGHRGQMFRTPHVMNYLCNLDETFRDKPLVPTDNLVIFGRSETKVKVTSWFKYVVVTLGHQSLSSALSYVD